MSSRDQGLGPSSEECRDVGCGMMGSVSSRNHGGHPGGSVKRN